MPYGVSTYLLFATLEMVDISIVISSAMSFKIIGLIFFSSPLKKYSFWKFTIADIVIIKVWFLCFIASMNHLAESSFCFMNMTASFWLLVFSFDSEYPESIFLYSWDTYKSGAFLELSFSLISPSTISIVKSGTIEELIFVFSLYAPPGFGFNFSISPTHSFKSSSERFSLFLILSKCLLENSSNKSSVILRAFEMFFVNFFLFSCKIRHCCKFFAPTPAGSRRYTLSKIFWISSSLASMPRENAKSSDISIKSLLKYPNWSKLPTINSAIFNSVSVNENECSWFFRNWLNEVPDANGIAFSFSSE